MQEENAVSALKFLINNGTKQSQAYGLVGLSILDSELLEKIKSLILKSQKKTRQQAGCWINDEFAISRLVVTNDSKNYNWLNDELLKRYEWLKKNDKLFKSI